MHAHAHFATEVISLSLSLKSRKSTHTIVQLNRSVNLCIFYARMSCQMQFLPMGSTVILLFLLYTILFSNPSILCKSFTPLGNETDRLALLTFRDRVTIDPFGALRSWNYTLHFCNWVGVKCASQHQRVTVLNLTNHRLEGQISPYLSNLTFLTEIHLQNNSFHGKIPQEIGRLFRLQLLNLSHNSFDGEIPSNLSHCSKLKALDLRENCLVGNPPTQLGSLSNLIQLHFESNNLTGTIPASFGNFSSLTFLCLQRNMLQGTIPNDLGRLWSLNYLRISFNNLHGTVPRSLFNLSSINYFIMAANRIEGSLPANMGLTLPSLQLLVLGGNRVGGPFPMSLTNASKLQSIDIANNYVNGPVPINLGRLTDLFRLSFQNNQLGNGKADDLNFLTSLTNCSGLRILGLGQNHFGGILPNSLANLSTQLTDLYLENNLLSGRIPIGIENLVSLTLLRMGDNHFEGSIPAGIGKLMKLEEMHLNGNRFSGQIPPSLGNLTQLKRLSLYGNSLEGSIPSTLVSCQNLQNLDLSRNQLNGAIPKEIFCIPALMVLSTSKNSLSGPLHIDGNSLKSLENLDVSMNKLSGEIPTMLGNCLHLQYLDLAENLFQGTIPPSLSNLVQIQGVDLSCNNLSGPIPEYFGKFLLLQYLNLSFNGLEGEVPKEGIFSNSSAVLDLGNNNLCWSTSKFQLSACSSQDFQKKGRMVPLVVIISVVSSVSFVILCAFIFAALYFRRKSTKKQSSTPSSEDPFIKVSYADLLQATNGFHSTMLIGMGSYGSVYKGILNHNETVVAVKVLNLQRRGASRSFIAECEVLRNIRHRNLVKTLTSCSSIDFKGNEFKALVFEYMPKGSLEKWLHPNIRGQFYWRNLNLIQRLNIAIDVATALDYLHHQCQTPIIHCDLKPSNILLDNNMIAHVGDFGLAQILSENSSDYSQNQASTIEIKGSIGYVAPEYGIGIKASTRGDVYSYGILLLEMFTGKRPTDDMFKDGLSLHQFAKLALPERVMQIADQRLLSEEAEPIEDDEIYCHDRNGLQDCLISVLTIGILCSSESPRERMIMRNVAVMLNEIRDLYLGVDANKDRRNEADILDES